MNNDISIPTRRRFWRCAATAPIVLGGDGQVTLGNTVMKGNARKVRRLSNGKVLAGFAGGTADAFTLFERFEGKTGEIRQPDPRRDRAGQGLARRSLSAPARGAAAGRRSAESVHHLGQRRCDRAGTSRPPPSARADPYAQAAARALTESTELDARTIVERSLGIAADICIYTNRNLVIEELRA